jgi:hypothetical protein
MRASAGQSPAPAAAGAATKKIVAPGDPGVQGIVTGVHGGDEGSSVRRYPGSFSNRLLLASFRTGLNWTCPLGQTWAMQRARRHHRLSAALAFALLALIAELVGRSLTHRLDVGRHVSSPSYAGADYYPFLLAGVKLGVALLLARLAWRFVRARAAARAGRRVLVALAARPKPAPRVRLDLSPRLWLAAFLVTSTFYLVQADAERAAAREWPLLWPWLHTSALPVFAVLAVLVALAWGAVARWLEEYERYAQDTCACAEELAAGGEPIRPQPAAPAERPPRKLFGLAFESRPPPLPA